MTNTLKSRLPFIFQDDLPKEKRYLFDRLTDESGHLLDMYRVLGHCPDILHQFMRLGSSLRYKTELNPKLRELAILTVSAVTGTAYEYVHHVRRARKEGVAENQLASLIVPEGNPAFNDQERAVIRYATEMTRDIRVSDATFEDVSSFLNNVQLLELTMTVAFYNMSVRFLRTMDIPLEIWVRGNELPRRKQQGIQP